MSFVQFKIFCGDNFERCKMHRMKKERFQLITATPVQAVHVRTERTIVNELAKRQCVSPVPLKQLHLQEQSTTAETTKYMSPLQVVFQEKRKAVDNQRRRVSQLWANSRGAGKKHRGFAHSFTIVLSVLPCTAWTRVAVAYTLTDSLYKSMELSTGRKHLQASIRSCTKDIFPSSGLWQRREKHDRLSTFSGQNGITWSVFCKPQHHKNVITWPELFNHGLNPTVPEASRKEALVHRQSPKSTCTINY